MKGIQYIVFSTLVGLGLVLPARGINVPLLFGSQTAIRDEFGNLLPGRHPDSMAWGLSPVTGALVQIIHSLDGTIYAPNPDGTPGSANNVVIQTLRIGEGINGALAESGQFGGSLDYFNRSQASSPKIFARVFNQADLADASFYADSSLYEVPTWGDPYSRFLADVTATDQPLDTSDADNDGMHASWEKSYGTDPGNPDSDEDGIRDGDEMLAGTDALDDESFLAMVELMPQGARDMMFMWAAVPGKVYQLQMNTNNLLNPAFTDLNDPVTAEAGVATTVVTNGQDLIDVHFRVRVITP